MEALIKLITAMPSGTQLSIQVEGTELFVTHDVPLEASDRWAIDLGYVAPEALADSLELFFDSIIKTLKEKS